MKTVGLLLIAIVLLVSGYFLLGINKTNVPDQLPASPTPMVEERSVKDQVITALSQKNNWDASRVELNVVATEGNYAKGDVKFRDEMGGGLWFAAKVNGTWEIVYDGQGMITCDMLTNYKEFPNDLIPQCLDKETNELVTR